MRTDIVFRCGALFLLLAVAVVPAFGQAPITAPLLNAQDSDNDTATVPLLQVQGGATSTTMGVQVTGKATSSAGTMPGFPYITSGGYGGLSLVQSGLAPTPSGPGLNSPFLSLCAQQIIASASTPECWYLQVQGGLMGTDLPDVLMLGRTSAQQNVTLNVPNALNFAVGDNNTGGQLTIGAMVATAADLSLKPITIVGGFTKSTSTSAIAAPLQLFPGFLNAAAGPSTNPAAHEGALQIGMAVKGNQTDGLLACYTTTAQTAQACPDVKSPLLGVYFTVGNGSTNKSNGVIAPPSRALVSSSSAVPTWTAGAEICRDPGHPNYAASAPSRACPLGQAVGVAVGDNPLDCPCASHLVDLNFSDQGVGSSGYWSPGPLSGVGSVTILSDSNQYAYGFYTPSVLAGSKIVLDLTAGDNSADTYSFGIFDSLGTLVAHTTAQSFDCNGLHGFLFRRNSDSSSREILLRLHRDRVSRSALRGSSSGILDPFGSQDGSDRHGGHASVVRAGTGRMGK